MTKEAQIGILNTQIGRRWENHAQQLIQLAERDVQALMQRAQEETTAMRNTLEQEERILQEKTLTCRREKLELEMERD